MPAAEELQQYSNFSEDQANSHFQLNYLHPTDMSEAYSD